MPSYDVHLYREMRLLFEGIEAGSHEEAAALARAGTPQMPTRSTIATAKTFAALVDVVGDEQYEQSRLIDFEAERLRQAAPKLLEAVRDQPASYSCVIRPLAHASTLDGCSVEIEDAWEQARATVADRRGAGRLSQPVSQSPNRRAIRLAGGSRMCQQNDPIHEAEKAGDANKQQRAFRPAPAAGRARESAATVRGRSKSPRPPPAAPRTRSSCRATLTAPDKIRKGGRNRHKQQQDEAACVRPGRQRADDAPARAVAERSAGAALGKLMILAEDIDRHLNAPAGVVKRLPDT